MTTMFRRRHRSIGAKQPRAILVLSRNRLRKEKVMAKAEFDLASWGGPPKSFTSGRKSGQPTVVVIHTTDGSEGPQSAEDGASYDQRRTDGTSTHFFVDSDSVVQCVRTWDEAHAARTHGNDIGIQIEVCGLAGQSTNQWNDKVSAATLENLAKLCVEIRKRFGADKFPLKRLTGNSLRSAWSNGSPRGFCGHVDITHAFPEDNGTHTDPGPNFPWTALFDRIKELEDTVALTPKEIEDIADRVVEKLTVLTPFANGGGQGSKVGNAVWGHGYPRRAGEARQAAYVNLQGLQDDIDGLAPQPQQP